ncbi:MAG TPA: signal peptidase II [Candidatus Cybelea sp.]|nr:signal peptidase II [Candidatus Cybelea sp.]
MRGLLGPAAAVLAFILDQASKAVLIDMLRDRPSGIELLPEFRLVMVWNCGISFGMFNTCNTSPWIFAAVALLLVAALGVWMFRVAERRIAPAIGLVIGGALGNVADRFRFGAVADFFDAHIGYLHWPAFNLADSAVVVGVLALVADALFADPEKG